jgi:hypothetical protein
VRHEIDFRRADVLVVIHFRRVEYRRFALAMPYRSAPCDRGVDIELVG